MIFIKGVSKKDQGWVDLIKNRVISLEYEQTDKGHDKFKLIVDNSDRSLLGADEVGIAVKSIIVQWGRYGKLTRARKINMVKIKGFKKITYEGTGTFWKFDLVRKNKLWKGMSHYEIVKSLGDKMGFGSLDIQDPKIKKPTVKQFETDMQFLMRLAKEVGYACWYDENGFHWKERDASQKTSLKIVYSGKFEEAVGYGRLIGEPSVEFGYNRAIPKKSTSKSPEQVEKIKQAHGGVVRNVDGKMVLLKKATTIIQKIAGDNTSSARKESYAEQCQINPAESNETTYAPAGKSYIVVGSQRIKSKKKVKVELSINGIVDLQRGQTVELYGFADLVDGKYYIKEMIDTVSGENHIQKLKLRRGSAPNKAKDADRVKGKTNRRCSGGKKSDVALKNQAVVVKTAHDLIAKGIRRIF